MYKRPLVAGLNKDITRPNPLMHRIEEVERFSSFESPSASDKDHEEFSDFESSL
jgi:hypothetical protein